MEQRTQILNLDCTQIQHCLHSLPADGGKFCFFDIETTGLSPQVSSVYLIGACFLDENSGNLQLTQWFADDYISEKDILTSFSAFTTKFDTLVTYNGATFDVPYLEKKYMAHTLPSPFINKNNLDIYKVIRKKKNRFSTANMKLATMEQLLGFYRTDSYTGKDCIELYSDFMKKKYFCDPLSLDLKEHLLLHNHDDIIGTFLCSELLCFCFYKPGQPKCRLEGSHFIVEDELAFPVPFSTVCSIDEDSVRFSGTTIHIEIPLYTGTLCHFFKDYKNYFYLPDEDMAVHKSVGIYVDAAHRQKATAANCYIKKDSTFLALPKKFIPDELPLYQVSRKDKVFYVEADLAVFSREFLGALMGEYV